MLTRMRVLFLLCMVLVCGRAGAQSMDYMRHNKIFNLCDFDLDCSGCYDCDRQKLTVKIKNLVEKKITKVTYVYYSSVKNKVVTKEATIIGSTIDYKQVGFLNVCVSNYRHWAISEIEYADGSKNSFVVKDRLETFIQEPDECDCNERTTLPNPNIR